MTASLIYRKHKRHPRAFTIAGANGVAQNFIESDSTNRGRRKTLTADVASTTEIEGEQ